MGYKGIKPNKCKQFWTFLCNSQHLDLWFSWRQVQRLLSFGCGSANLLTFHKNLLPPKQQIWLHGITSKRWPIRCTNITTVVPSAHHCHMCTEWLPRHLHYKATFPCTVDKSTRPMVTKKWRRWGLFSVCVVHSSSFIWQVPWTFQKNML